MMKRSWGLALVALLIGLPAFAQEAAPATGIQAGGVAKMLYSYAARDEETRYDGRNAFSLSLIDLRLSGRVGEHVGWNMEVAASWNPDFDMGNVGAFANQNETGGAGVRQASIRFYGIVPYTTFEVGTFIPHLTNYMARPVEDLDLIQYPLMNNAALMQTGFNPAEIDVSPWQQTGFNAEIRLPYMLEVDFGVWNGMMPGRIPQPDPNLSKAASIVLTYKPIEHLSLSMAHWGENFQNNTPGMGRGLRQLNIWYFYASYITDTLEVTADFAQALVPGQLVITSTTKGDWRWEGGQVTVGYWFRPKFEALVRYESFDPNTLDTVKIPVSRFDESRWWTMGINYRLNDHAEVSVNYIVKLEEAEFVDKGVHEKDPNLPGYDPKYNAQHNNLVLVQFQIWQ